MHCAPKLTVVDTIAALRQFVSERRKQNANLCVALVPTMGALHDGHLQLVHQARQYRDNQQQTQNVSVAAENQQSISPSTLVIVSIFVNPLQFGPNEDYARYPRTLEADLAKLESAAVDCAFVPTVQEMFGKEEQQSSPGGDGIGISAGRIGRVLEGVTRPLYHDGMLLHVAKLYNIVQPNAAFFGKKDAQQLFAIQQLTTVLNFPVRVVPVDTKREPDGLALSSRNLYLSTAERQRSLCIYNTLMTARDMATKGANLAIVMAQAEKFFAEAEKRDGIKKDYIAVVDPNTFIQLEVDKMKQFKGRALVLIAAFMGSTRLIDNMEVDIVG